jgi:hypothetical protein
MLNTLFNIRIFKVNHHQTIIFFYEKINSYLLALIIFFYEKMNSYLLASIIFL